ncbi:hypothetical protein GCM10010399_36970 [Dactylosporangium fulvum]|uniref:Serine aminopeptidase S33 domain-containing protein n=1 Tax=Dactylosporangium fulvum TaxID=53359 RepID=A0ABY5W9B3_9ACTN|nr:hypothetical protein [Dactylosporangium fulvum]UWP86462.1 hypothetical protein Dfulv_20355 [Dactylosporangium fulvum]
MATGAAPGHADRLLTHGDRRPRAVLMLHGYTHSPAQLDVLAGLFFDRGYNVSVPRAPHHGVATPGAHAAVTVEGLLAYAGNALDLAATLGDEVGVIGVSGGAVLATWLAAHRGDTVSRLLALAPLYAPHPGRIPPVLLRPLIRLYGLGLLPDRIDSRGYSYRAVARYLRIAADHPSRPRPGALRHVAVAVSAGDTVVDRRSAFDVPARLAAAAGATLVQDTLPAELGLGHNIVSPIGSADDALARRYLALYENTPLDLPPG